MKESEAEFKNCFANSMTNQTSRIERSDWKVPRIVGHNPSSVLVQQRRTRYWNCAEVLETHDFDFHATLDIVLSREKAIQGVERRGMIVALPAIGARFRFDVFHNEELTVQPVRLFDPLDLRLAAAELTDHESFMA